MIEERKGERDARRNGGREGGREVGIVNGPKVTASVKLGFFLFALPEPIG